MDSDKKVNLTQNFKDKIDPKSQFLKKKIPGVKKIVAIASAKGGVGKSTICANLAVASAKRNYLMQIFMVHQYRIYLVHLKSQQQMKIKN